jgi:hypothetical protein
MPKDKIPAGVIGNGHEKGTMMKKNAFLSGDFRSHRTDSIEQNSRKDKTEPAVIAGELTAFKVHVEDEWSGWIMAVMNTM